MALGSQYYGRRFHEKELAKFGGTNLVGLPLYRLVEADKVIEKQGGEHHTWDESTDLALRGGIVTDPETGLPVESPYKALSIVTDVLEVQRYDQWGTDLVLERWFPVHVIAPGGEAAWYEHKVPGTNLPALGPYPDEGDYKWMIGPFKELPSLHYLSQLIDHWERNREQMTADKAKYVRAEVERDKQAREKRRKQVSEENAYRLRDKMSPANSTSLAAGRWRQEQLEKAGLRYHVGN